MTVLRCTAMTKNGEPCEAFANYTEIYCASHDPDRRRRDAQYRIPRLQQRRTKLLERIADLQKRIDEVDAKIERDTQEASA